MEPKKVTNHRQFDILVSELEKKPHLARQFHRGLVATEQREWEEITNKINKEGPPMRDLAGWQKVWKDLKAKVSKKLSFNKAESVATGGGAYRQMLLSPNEEIVANLLKFSRKYEPSGKVCGNISKPATQIQEYEPPVEVFVEISNATILKECEPPVKVCKNTSSAQIQFQKSNESLERYDDKETISEAKRTKNHATKKSFSTATPEKSFKSALLQKQAMIQEKLYKEVSSSLKSIESYLKENGKSQTEVSTSLKAIALNSKEDAEIRSLEIELKKRKIELLDLEIQSLKKQR